MSSEAKSTQLTQSTTTLTSLVSRHSAGLSLALSRYKRQWFLSYPRAYGMVAFPGQRIVCKLNTPDQSADEAYARNHFWLNADMPSQPYDPAEKDDESKKYIMSPIHILLESETPVARLTGRTRTEKSNPWQDNGKEITCYEVEVTLPEDGLQRQCYYCLCWEYEGETERLVPFADDMYWCESVGTFLSDCQIVQVILLTF